jgi:hypothetical protein
VPVSRDASPVTVKDEVEVKRASKKFVALPELDETGSIRRIVPRTIRPVNAAAIDWVAESLTGFFISGSNLSAPTRAGLLFQATLSVGLNPLLLLASVVF